ncbi:MAG: cyclic nucleotide-binding domain-containing protein [Candidatus Marinimicrobia bacterium]|nr:cyclic nucleotide-binding domain-containing protein [Candidatus Neomarinimicrobiota bacterium]
MVTSEIRQIVASSPLFNGLKSESISDILDSSQEISFESGQLIMSEGDRFGNLYIITEGEVQIEKEDKESGEVKVFHTRKIGASLGEMSLIDMNNRSATVRAKTSVKAISIKSELMSTLFDQDPKILTSIAINIAKILSERLREADEIISNRPLP